MSSVSCASILLFSTATRRFKARDSRVVFYHDSNFKLDSGQERQHFLSSCRQRGEFLAFIAKCSIFFDGTEIRNSPASKAHDDHIRFLLFIAEIYFQLMEDRFSLENFDFKLLRI